jgi:uncharacterized hydrophobic protein (TIGR00271 family)
MLNVQLYVPDDSLAACRTVLADHEGVSHIVQVGASISGGTTLVIADVDPGVLDALLPALVDVGVSGDEITIVHVESSRPFGTPAIGDIPAWSGGGVAWTELAMASRHYARAVPLYLVFMGCAGVIAALGILTRNTILIVGAMAISPDLLPMCATCVGVVGRRLGLAARALAALVIGLLMATATSYAVTETLRLGGYAPANGALGDGGLGVLPQVNIATIIVAFAAGIAGVLAFETRSSSAVGVAISITTIPAAAFFGAAMAVRDAQGAIGALAVLGANVGILVFAGSLTLAAQRGYRQWRRAAPPSASPARAPA